MDWQLPSRVSTCIIIEHPKAVSVVVPEELPCNDPVVPLDHLQLPSGKAESPTEEEA